MGCMSVVDSQQGQKFVSLPPCLYWISDRLSSSYWGLFHQGMKTDHSLVSRTEVKNVWGYICSPHVYFHGIVLN